MTMGSSQASSAPAASRFSTAGGVVDVRFQKRQLPGRALELADHGAQEVRRVLQAGPAGAVSDGDERHRRGRVGEPAAGKGGHQGRAGGGGGLAWLLRPADLRALEDLQGGRSRYGQAAVGGPDDSGPHGQRSASHRRDVQKLQRHAATHHVHDGVDGPDLVKRHLLGVNAVDRALGYRQAAERLHRAPGGPLREARALYEGADLPKVPVGVLFGMVDRHAERAHTVYLGLFG
jgi:hypothetical protein